MPETVDVPSSGLSRRGFLWSTAAGAALCAAGPSLLAGAGSADAAEIGPAVGANRADAARDLRIAAANFQRAFPLPDHPDNGDEARYPDRWASYSKALLHNDDGSVVTAEYSKLLTALGSGRPADFEALATSAQGNRALVDPQAAYAYALEGADSHAFKVPPAPAAGSADIQGEMAELYWMALTRDIPFDLYGSDGSGLIQAAVTDLNRFSRVASPRVNGAITPQSLVRDVLPDNLTGNYVSQYLLQTVPYGAQQIIQFSRRRPAGEDQLTSYPAWLAVQRGTPPAPLAQDTPAHYPRNGRDLAEWVHSDFPTQAALNAARIIAAQGSTGDPKYSPNINDRANPYLGYARQIPFVTFGNQNFFDLLTRVPQLALQAAWYQKWLVHRRLRPEEYGGRVESTLRRNQPYGIGSELTASLQDPNRLGRVFARWNSYLLPTAFPEGSPTHPAYPSGHSTYVAAGITMIKAFVDGTRAVANPVRVADPNNGDAITPTNDSLTINGELDKVVMNVGIGRLLAGVHWRSDHTYGVRLGELVAIRALQDILRTYAEPFAGFDLRRFDGTTVTVTATQVQQNGTAVATTNVIDPVPYPG